MQLIFESFLSFEEFGNLNFEFFTLTAQDIYPTVIVAGLECYLLEFLVQLLNPLLVDHDLRDVLFVCISKIFDILVVFFFFTFDVALMQRLLFLNVSHKLCKTVSLVLSKFLQLSNLPHLLLYGLLKILIDILELL